MSTPLELATTAATGIVGAMATRTWAHVRERCVALLRRYLDEESGVTAVTRLDEQRQTLVDTPADARDALAAFVTQDTTRLLRAVLERSPEAAEPLRALGEEARSATASGESVVSDIRLDNVKADGDVVGGGRDVRVEKSRTPGDPTPGEHDPPPRAGERPEVGHTPILPARVRTEHGVPKGGDLHTSARGRVEHFSKACRDGAASGSSARDPSRGRERCGRRARRNGR